MGEGKGKRKESESSLSYWAQASESFENDMGIILSLSGFCLRTKTQGKKRILFADQDLRQKF